MSDNVSTDKWDQRWMSMALLVAAWSKDPRTHVGAVLVRDRRILSTGYNGFPSGTSDDVTIYENRPEKIRRVVHAEANAIAQAAMFGHATQGATCFSTFPICCKCAGLLIQAGIARVVYPEDNSYDHVAHEYLGWDLSIALFESAGVMLDAVDMYAGTWDVGGFEESMGISTQTDETGRGDATGRA